MDSNNNNQQDRYEQQQYEQQQYEQQQHEQQNKGYVNIEYNDQTMNNGTQTVILIVLSMLPNVLLILSIASLFCCEPLSIITLILSIIYSCILGKNNKIRTARIISIISIIFFIISIIVILSTELLK